MKNTNLLKFNILLSLALIIMSQINLKGKFINLVFKAFDIGVSSEGDVAVGIDQKL